MSKRLHTSNHLRRHIRLISSNVLRMEANARLFRLWKRCEKRTQFLVKITQGRIMEEECVINPREPLHDGVIHWKLLTHFHKSANHIEAHLHRLRAVENIGCLQCAVLCESPRTIRLAAMLA